MKPKQWYFVLWKVKEDALFRPFFKTVTGIRPKTRPDVKGKWFVYETDRLREIQKDALTQANFKSVKVLKELPKYIKIHEDRVIIGTVDFMEDLPLASLYKDQLVRVEKQKEPWYQRLKGYYKSDGTAWTKIRSLR